MPKANARVPWLLLIAVFCAVAGWSSAQTPGKDGARSDDMLPPPRLAGPVTSGVTADPQDMPVDLPSALRMAGVQNPEILLALERVEEAIAFRQLAAAQLLPTVNAGTNVNTHQGPLQASTGQIVEVNRGDMYLGLGAFAVGAGTVNIPGLVWTGNVSDAIYANLVTRQRVRQQQFASQAVRNDVLVRVADAYLELVRAEGHLAIAVVNREEATEVARVTAEFASKKGGLAKKSDADRTAAELDLRRADVAESEGQVQVASARLAQVLSVTPATRLHTADTFTVPRPLVPDAVSLPELLAIALTQRPELGERQAAIRAALLELDAAKLLPFSPNLLVGYSSGTFGGGSNLVSEGIKQPDGSVLQQSRFGSFAGRQDVDAVVWWSLRNLGLGNAALVRVAQSKVRSDELRRIEVLDRIRAEVAVAQARSQARLAQIGTTEQAVKTSTSGFKADVERTRLGVGLPFEVLDSMRLLARSRYAYLDAIVDYNRAQFELYGALGQPTADYLARPAAAPKGP
jgi:outer membrane protein TolC